MGYNFLLIDDSKIVRKVLIRTIGMTDLTVDNLYEADNGAIGLKLLEKSLVDLIFLDINMPVMNGIDFMKKISSDPRLAETPVIIVSTEGSEERKAELDRLGIKAYLRKPVSPEDLTDTVQTILTNHK